MRNNFCYFSSLLMLTFVAVSGCRNDQQQKDVQKEKNQYLKQFQSEIERNESVRSAIKNAVITSTDPKVLAFHEFLSHWHLRWPVVREGAFGEGGIGFAWHKDLQKF